MRDHFHFDPGEVCAEPADLQGPLHVEIGFGKDIRILRAAVLEPEARFLGVEISRKKAVSFCRKVARTGLRNVRSCHGDVREVLDGMLAPGSAASFTILFPDPWPKRRHRKHRWITAETARLLARALVPGGPLIVATDHAGYCAQIKEAFAAAGLELELESPEVPAEDRTLYALRFEERGESVTYMRWRKPCSGPDATTSRS